MRAFVLILAACVGDPPQIIDQSEMLVCPSVIRIPRGEPGDHGQFAMRIAGRGQVGGLRWRPGVGSSIDIQTGSVALAGRHVSGCIEFHVPYRHLAHPVRPIEPGRFVDPGGWLEVPFLHDEITARPLVHLGDTGFAGGLDACETSEQFSCGD